MILADLAVPEGIQIVLNQEKITARQTRALSLGNLCGYVHMSSLVGSGELGKAKLVCAFASCSELRI